MVYNPKLDWKNEPDKTTPITAADLIRIETGIADGDLTNQGSAASTRAGQIFEPIGLSDTTKTYVSGAIVASAPALWQPSTDYLAGQRVISPLGLVRVAIADFTSGASYDWSDFSSSTEANVKDFGALGDGTTDDYAAIQAALDYLDARSVRGGVLYFPNGVYVTSAQLESGQYTLLCGDGRNSTTIKAAAGFTAGTYVLRMGKTGVDGALFGCRVERLTIDASAVARGVYTERWNEGSGVQNIAIRDAVDRGLHVGYVTGQVAAGYTITQAEISLNPTASTSDAKGLYIQSGARWINDVTVNSTDGATQMPSGSWAIVLDRMSGMATNLHPEHFANGVMVGESGACSGITLKNIGGHSTVTTLVQVTSGLTTTAFTVENLRLNGGTTVLADQVNGNTLTDSILAFYYTGSGITGTQSIITSSSSVRARFAFGADILGSYLHIERASSSNRAAESKVTSFGNNSWQMSAAGLMEWGPGTGDTVNVQLGYVAKSALGMGADDGFSTGHGATGSRPNASANGWPKGTQWWDETLLKPIYWDGTGWRDSAGASV